ncbi:MAG: hypothetical protein M3R25_11290 [Bacteroidota bacterium]|nr:hypothetical protein [Bacteroidota bacterium]
MRNLSFYSTRIKPSFLFLAILVIASTFIKCKSEVGAKAQGNTQEALTDTTKVIDEVPIPDPPKLDTALYNAKLLDLVHNQPTDKWPVKTNYPLPGALLPFNRIIAYYGNLYTPRMGILGEKPSEDMLKKLQAEVKNWEAADTATPVIPALHYIAVTAQHDPGKGKKYRLRMPFHQIDEILELAKSINGIVFIDIQVGHSTLQEEIPEFEKYLLMPNVHLGIDPEYSMKSGHVPSARVGTFDAADVNYAATYLADLVKQHNLPPKILVVHRFTKGMVTNYKNIELRPEVQIVMHMDGFGFAAKKIDTYRYSVTNEPVQFAGFKVFYKNDTADKKYPALMLPDDILALFPKPVYIQYQ